MEFPYTVPVIPYNLSKNETVIQVADVLDHLSNVTESLLNCISRRIDSSSQKLKDIDQRIDVVNKKIKKLTGAKKATQVFSSSKYPAADIERKYVSIFSDAEFVKLNRTRVKHQSCVRNDDPLEKLHVYHVKLKGTEEKGNYTGLGPMPTDLDCVNDLLLYNSGKNIYKNYTMSDVLNISKVIRKKENVDKPSELEPAPYSIRERANRTRSAAQPYVYSPNLGEVPTLDVPLDLPDLPGIADDLRYEYDDSPAIAPSVTTTPHIPDLPLIESLATSPVRERETTSVDLPPPPVVMSEIIKGEKKSVDVSKVEHHKEEPYKKVELVRTTPQETKEEASRESVEVNDVELPLSTELKKNIPEKGSTSPSFDMHASLMDAIRKAGGAKKAKLRSIEAEQVTTIKPSGGGDLMADLHAKLSMRRKGISGSKKHDNPPGVVPGPSSAMERISAMIPPPVPKGDLNDSTNTEDDEWEE